MSGPISVNFVTSRNLGSKIFSDIFRRFKSHPALDVLVSERPEPGHDIYHYHRPQFEDRLLDGAVVTMHHDLDDPGQGMESSRFLPRYSEAGLIICLSKRQQRQLHDHGIEHTAVIPHGYDDRLFAAKPPKQRMAGGKIRLGFVSRRYPRLVKGEVFLYRIADELDTSRFSFLLVGEGRSVDAVHLESLGFEVECFDSIPYRLFSAVYERMDALLILSHCEGGPANVPEALATSTPVLSTPVGLVPDLVQHGENGFVLDDRDLNAWVEMLNNFAGNVDGVSDHLAGGAAASRGKLMTWTDVIDAHTNRYRELILAR